MPEIFVLSRRVSLSEQGGRGINPRKSEKWIHGYSQRWKNPLGIVQLYYAVDAGYWYARSLDFLNLPWVNILEWARLPGDALLIRRGFASGLALLAGLTLSKPAPDCYQSDARQQ